MIENFLQDLRYAIRSLGRNPMLAVTATLILAISIGANITVFSLVNSILLRPLSFPDSRQIYWISERMGRDQLETGLGPDYYTLREENRIFEDIGAYDTATLNWSGSEQPEQLDAAQVTPSFFRVLGTQPMVGRYLAAGEQGKKAPPVVVVSYTFWRSRLGSDRRIVGKTVTLDGLSNTVIGVMPQGFDYPHGTQIWKPLEMDEAEQLPRSVMTPMRTVYMLARLKPSKGEPAARADIAVDTEMARLTRAIRAEYPKPFETAGFLNGMRISASPLQRRLTGDLRPALLVLTGAVGLVLLIACANLANVLLARAAGRQREMAVRLALGSGRRRIVAQILTESVATALPGGLAGIMIAGLAVYALNTWTPLVLASYPRISMDLPTLAFSSGLTLITALVFGLAPAMAASGISIQDALKSAGYTQSGGRRASRLRQFLVVAELGVSLVLLIGAGLLARSFLKLSRSDLGFPPQNLLTMRVNLTGARYQTAARQTEFYQNVLDRVRRLPGVRQAAFATDLPLSGEAAFSEMAFTVVGRPPVPIAQRPSADITAVSPGFFRTMGIPLHSGRIFDTRDSIASPSGVLVNEIFARRIFPGEGPIGRSIMPPGNSSPWTIVGVVGNIRGRALGAVPESLLYRCTCESQDPNRSRMRLIVRTVGDARSAIHVVEDQVFAVDRSQPVFDVKTMDQRVADALAPQRFHLLVIGSFAAIAILLAALGVYGVMSYLVTRRTREIGIRIAMGAVPRQVARLIVGESVVLAMCAITAGMGAAWGLTRYLKSMLYGMTALDAATFITMPLLLAAIAVAAAYLPARRASRIEPTIALREE
jgi:predicted permease